MCDLVSCPAFPNIGLEGGEKVGNLCYGLEPKWLRTNSCIYWTCCCGGGPLIPTPLVWTWQTLQTFQHKQFIPTYVRTHKHWDSKANAFCCFCLWVRRPTHRDMSADKTEHNKNFVLAQPCHKVTQKNVFLQMFAMLANVDINLKLKICKIAI